MKNRKESLVFLLIAFLMTFSVSLASIQYTDLEYQGLIGIPLILLFSFLFSLLCKLLFRSLLSVIVFLSSLLLLASTLYLIVFYGGDSGTISLQLIDFFDFLKEFMFQWRVSLFKPDLYQQIIMLGIILLISIVMHLSLCRFKKVSIAVILASFIFIAQWYLIHEVQKLAFFVYLPCVFLLYILSIHRKKSLSTKEENKAFFDKNPSLFKLSTVLLVLSLCIVFLFPLNRAAIKITWLDSLIKENGSFKKTIKYDDFTLVDTGFSTGTGVLNTSVSLGHTEVLNIYGEKPLYLKGAVYDIYTGNRWIKKEDDSALSYYDVNNSRLQALDELYYGTTLLLLSKDMSFSGNDLYHENPSYLLDAISVKKSVSQYSFDHMLFDSKIATLVYKNLQTPCIFTPPYSSVINQSQAESITIDKNEVFKNALPLTNGQRISMEYVDVNYVQDDFTSMLSNSREGFYYSMSTYLDEFANYVKAIETATNNLGLSSSNTTLTYTEFEESYQFYKNKLAYLMEEAQKNIIDYTLLPNNISDRVRELAYLLTKDAENNYEKVKNIETYFKYGFTYTLSPVEMDKDQEFVDFFLFESKEGYCSSFASAMTVMVRSLGIPARYVEGYVMPNKTINENLFSIKSSNAHAWVEVYFEGFGWVPFEPTFAFAYMSNETFEGDSVLDDELTSGQYDQYLEYLIEDEFLDDFDPTISEDLSPIFEPDDSSLNQRSNKMPIDIQSILLLLALVLTLIYIYIKVTRNYQYGHIRSNKAFKNRYLYLIKTLTRLKYPRQSNQTLIEYASSIDDIFHFGEISFTDITKIYYQIIYSNHIVSEKECQLLGQFYKVYKIALKDDVDLLEYILKRYIFPII